MLTICKSAYMSMQGVRSRRATLVYSAQLGANRFHSAVQIGAAWHTPCYSAMLGESRRKSSLLGALAATRCNRPNSPLIGTFRRRRRYSALLGATRCDSPQIRATRRYSAQIVAIRRILCSWNSVLSDLCKTCSICSHSRTVQPRWLRR